MAPSASPSLEALARSYESTRKRAPQSIADLPTSTRQADALAKQLKSQGYRFVGPTSVYAFMQNVSAWSTTTSTAASELPTTTRTNRRVR
jgi:3-methyladenine DNA glycosylase Tag